MTTKKLLYHIDGPKKEFLSFCKFLNKKNLREELMRHMLKKLSQAMNI